MRPFRTKFFLYTIYCILSTVLLGCVSVSNGVESDPQSLQAQSLLKFSDLPVPAGFKILAQNSYSFQSSGMRTGLLRYQGKATLDQIVNFYKEQMAMYNWTLLNVTEYGDGIMNFERDQESCIISISPKGSVALISIALGPKSQVLPKKTKQTIK